MLYICKESLQLMASKLGKILVVDDNQGIRRALEILLPMHFAQEKTNPAIELKKE